ncbi:purine-cytosine permease family protein [Rhodococcus zopfii]|uniref:purine-cytosine permease family protein n=1 Tax=Rhodococcus zopfii TaxID=43772 RepID=UPI0036683270
MPDQLTDSVPEPRAERDHVPDSGRMSRWSLTMAWWAMFSAMFWLYIAIASAGAVGVPATLVGMAASVVTFGVVNLALSRYAIHTGLSVELLSRRMFGAVGSLLAPALFAATALYYGVFEGSIVAVALQEYFGGDIRLWYLLCTVYMIPVVIGGVAAWLDKLNGILLPFHLAGMVAVVVAATVQQGYPTGWLTATVASGPLPGWLTAYLVYMGVWVLMMYTIDYARLGRSADAGFHGTVTFGWVFYAVTFGFNGLIGLYLLGARDIAGTESGVVEAVVGSLGFAGVLLIIVSQTRINSANFHLASTNLQVFARRALGLDIPRAVWVVVTAVLAYLLMLTDVLGYLLQALAWQGVLITAWVAIALVYVLRDRCHLMPGTASGGVPAWLISSAAGIALTVQKVSATWAQLAPVVTVALAAGSYALLTPRAGVTDRRTAEPESSPDEAQPV